MNIYTDLARETVEKYLEDNELPDLQKLPAELKNKRAGCFVSIHLKKTYELRGCIGTITPQYKNLGGEIIANAIEAAFRDPRFNPLQEEELENLKFSVDVLGEPEKIALSDTKNKLDPKKYGVIVRAEDHRTGLLLPNIDDVETIEEQIAIARKKGGIAPDKPIELFRFRTQRFEE